MWWKHVVEDVVEAVTHERDTLPFVTYMYNTIADIGHPFNLGQVSLIIVIIYIHPAPGYDWYKPTVDYGVNTYLVVG